MSIFYVCLQVTRVHTLVAFIYLLSVIAVIVDLAVGNNMEEVESEVITSFIYMRMTRNAGLSNLCRDAVTTL